MRDVMDTRMVLNNKEFNEIQSASQLKSKVQSISKTFKLSKVCIFYLIFTVETITTCWRGYHVKVNTWKRKDF